MTIKKKLHSILLVSTALILFLTLISSVASAFPVTCNVVSTNYEYEGWPNEQYLLINLLGQKYVPLLVDNDPIWKSHVNKLAKLVLDSRDMYTFRTGDSLDLGQGYAIEAREVNVDSKNMVLLEFTKDGVLIDDELFEIAAPRNYYPEIDGQRTWEVKLDDIQGEDDVVVLKVQVKQVFGGAVGSIIYIQGVWLIDYANVKVFQNGDKFEGFKLINIINGLDASNLGSLIFESSEIRLTQNGIKANEPAIYDDKVVWSDNTEGLGIIHLYNLTTGKDIKIGFSSASHPAIYDNKIVWLDNSSGNLNLNVYDVHTSTSSHITKNVTRESIPSIYGSRIVWRSNGNFYMSDISTSIQTQITNGSNYFSYPDIYGDRIVYKDYRVNDLYIYMYNISTHTETMITNSGNHNAKIYGDSPKIYGDKIIWTDDYFGNDDLWMYDLVTNEKTHITEGFNFGRYYEIYGDRIVRINDIGNGGYLYLYNISTSSDTRMTSSRSAQGNPAIYGDRIVWEGEGIYMCDLSPAANAPIAAFTANVTSGTAPLVVLFTDTSTGEAPTSWYWHFGDGINSKKAMNATHTFTNPGNYTIGLTVENAAGNSTVTKPGYIVVIDPNAPVANFNSNVTEGYAPLTVQFNDFSQKVASRIWDFNNDGKADSGDINPVYVYANPRTYTVNLTVSNENGTNSKTTAINVLTPSRSSGGSSGGSSHSSGGNAGGSPEPARNVEVKELSQVFITNGNPVKFNFPKNATAIVYLSFDSKKTVGKTTTIVEMLKTKSTLTPDSPEGEVYNYLNIWVGNSGYATEKNIENSVVCFRVEKSWMQDKGIDKPSITLNRYSDKKWNELPTTLLREDDKYLYFTAQTPGFSPFAITGKTIVEEAGTEIQPESDTKDVKNNGSSTIDVEQDPEKERNTSMPDFEIVYGVLGLLGIFWYNRR